MGQAVQAKECRSVYGGGEVCEYGDLSIDKQVLNPDKNEYWDHINSSDYVFTANQEVTFKIRVKNTSDIKIDHIGLRDFMPSYLTYVRSDRQANWLSDQKKAEWTIDDLDPGETETFYITFKVMDKDQIPSGYTELSNRTEAQKDNGNTKSDNSNFWIAKDKPVSPKVLGAKMPDTGVDVPTVVALELLVLGGLGMGYVLKAKSK